MIRINRGIVTEVNFDLENENVDVIFVSDGDNGTYSVVIDITLYLENEAEVGGDCESIGIYLKRQDLVDMLKIIDDN